MAPQLLSAMAWRYIFRFSHSKYSGQFVERGRDVVKQSIAIIGLTQLYSKLESFWCTSTSISKTKVVCGFPFYEFKEINKYGNFTQIKKKHVPG